MPNYRQQVQETGGNPDYYLSFTLTTLYVEKVFGGRLSTINITNDSTTDTVQFSFNGATLDGEIRPGESIKINVDQKSSIYVKATAGGDSVRLWGWAVISASSVTTTFTPLGFVNSVFEDTSFVVGDSPVTLDFNAAAGRNAVDGWVTCDGAGDMTVAFSRDGITFGDAWTMKTGETMSTKGYDIDSIKITHVADSAYRVNLI